MSLEENYGNNYSPEDVEKHGKALLDKYGPEACNAASVIESQNITDSTAQSYKPQVRHVLSGCGDMNPTPRAAADFISNVDKKSSTKSLMVSAMESYYNAIGDGSKGDKLREISNQKGITDKNFNTEASISGWITREEVDIIQDQLLPDEGENIKRLDFPDKSWIMTPEHKALAMTLYYTACRVGEICRRHSEDEALSVEDVYPENNQVNLYRLKKGGTGYKRDMKAVPQELIDVLQEYMNLKDIEEGQIFPFTTRTAQNRIKDISEAYQHGFGEFKHMDKLTPHKFRHGRITDIANNSSLEDAGQYVDHASPETTNQYRHLAVEEQRAILPEENDGSKSELDELMDKLGVDSIEEAIKIADKLE